MPTVRFIPSGATQLVDAGTTLLEAARRAGVIVPEPCNGVGTCGKCRVRVAAAQREHLRESPHGHLSQQERDAGWVLACQSIVLGDLDVETATRKEEGLKIVSEGHTLDVAIKPWITKTFNPATQQTDVFAGDRVLTAEPGDTAQAAFGAAIDIGTTTLVVSLIDLLGGNELAVASSLNPQARHAQDVLSRIKMGSQTEGLRQLQTELIEVLNRLISQTATEAKVSARHIYEAVFSGNTTMLHLAVGANPTSLGKYPYTPVLQGGESVSAADLGLAIAPDGLVYLPPIMSAYVGADITSGILATKLAALRGVTLFVDIGTNGEMLLAADGKLTATSTAAGPAFEGMNIACGMRASRGAIESVELSEINDQRPETGDQPFPTSDFRPPTFGLQLRTIGGDAPVGLCGSGLLDAVGELAANGIVDKNGRFQTANPSWQNHFETLDGKPVFRIAGPVYLSQKDVRQVQLAKAAVRAGIELMLAANGVGAHQVDRVLIAGSFGFHLRTASLINLGLLPREFHDRVAFVGNTSKSGARAFLLNRSLRDELSHLVRRVRVLELANDPTFEKIFVKALSF